MLSNSSIKNSNGISKVAIIIIVAVIIVAIIGVVLFLVISQNNNKNNTNVSKVPETEVVWDTNNEITTEEKNDLKEKYLGIFALLASNDALTTDDEKLVEVASELVKAKENEKSKQDNVLFPATNNYSRSNSTTNTVVDGNNTISNTITTEGNSLNNSAVNIIQTSNVSLDITGTASPVTSTQTLRDDTIVITEDNSQSTMSTVTNSIDSTNTIGGNTNTITGNVQQVTSSINQDNVEKAISEVKDQTISNVSTALSKLNMQPKDTQGFVTDIVSISKANGVYDITYKVCYPKKDELIKYGTVDKINTAAADRLEKTTINIELTRNRDFDYSEYKVKSIASIGTEVPVAYHLSFTNGKYGVIDENGNTVINNLYDMVMIPNNYKDIFICQTGTSTTVLNKNGQTIFEEYPNITVIQSTAGGESWWYEKEFLVYQLNGKFGAIDYDGFQLFEPIYDSIEPLYYLEGKVILTQNGRKALGDITGKVISNFKYSEIGLLGGQFSLESMVTAQRTIEQVQQMIQTGVYIIGKDVNESTEIIQIISADEYMVDFSKLPQMNYPETLNGWTYNSVQGYSIYTK